MREEWQQLHSDSIVWIPHDHFYRCFDTNLAMRDGGVTAKAVIPVADSVIYNDSQDEGVETINFGGDHGYRYAHTPYPAV